MDGAAEGGVGSAGAGGLGMVGAFVGGDRDAVAGFATDVVTAIIEGDVVADPDARLRTLRLCRSKFKRCRSTVQYRHFRNRRKSIVN